MVVGFLPLPLLIGRHWGVRLAFLHGLVAWWISIAWVSPTLESYGGLPGWLSHLLTLLPVAGLAGYHALFVWLGGRLPSPGRPPLWLSLPALWVALEWLRTYLLLGFPWNLVGYAWEHVPGALVLSAWVGVQGVSFLVVLVAVGLAVSLGEHVWEPGVLGLLLSLLVLGAAGRWAGPETDLIDQKATSIRILQPNIPNLSEWDEATVQRHYRRLLELSEASCDRPGTLLIWPESAAWPYLWGRDARLREDVERLNAAGCAVLFNSAVQEEGDYFNSALLVDSGQLVARYDKRHLVPFGEYVPWTGVLPFVSKLARNAGDFVAAETVALLPWRGYHLGTAICFEAVFPQEVAELVRHGATMLVVLSNDAWYGDSSAPRQLFRAARFRAAENARPLLRAGVTGISGVINPDGTVAQRVELDEVGVLAYAGGGSEHLTLYTRAPWLVPLSCSLLALFAIFRRRR